MNRAASFGLDPTTASLFVKIFMLVCWFSPSCFGLVVAAALNSP